jgi:hypothetical protein
MQQPIVFEDTGKNFLISLDKSAFEADIIFQILNRFRVEYLARKADFGEETESIGEEIKAKWWENNKQRFISQKR